MDLYPRYLELTNFAYQFIESQGIGIHIVMAAKTALEIGAPIRGILAFMSTSTDKAGRSIPAPGHSALSVARELPSKYPSLVSVSITVPDRSPPGLREMDALEAGGGDVGKEYFSSSENSTLTL
ncbi:hypothetical protein EV702DRAFT_1201582 [Suillus placidus]|uniref:Uncharacterized protein n=1 Tax=Suillus placidus TaxID=48579 RepID=A0A9P6ZM81_9AGAM|nr:hypothetical protein EV702DRAFT_1201582 [Suillus placidus]